MNYKDDTYHYLQAQIGVPSEHGHFFGYDPTVTGLSRDLYGFDVELVATINCADPILRGFGLPDQGLLRLAFPLSRYSDKHLQKQISDEEVVFPELRDAFQLRQTSSTMTDATFIPLPMTPFQFVPKQAAWGGAEFNDKYPDIEVTGIVIGAPAPTMQEWRDTEVDGRRIYNQTCPNCESGIIPTVTISGLLEADPLRALQMRGQSVLVVFWVCQNCRTVISHNDCD